MPIRNVDLFSGAVIYLVVNKWLNFSEDLLQIGEPFVLNRGKADSGLQQWLTIMSAEWAVSKSDDWRVVGEW